MTTVAPAPGAGELAPSADRPVLEVRDLVQSYKIPRRGMVRGGVVHAVDHVSFDLSADETLGVVGETGCGKTSLARAVMQLPPPTSGRVVLQGADLTTLKSRGLLEARRHLQMVFQDPYSSLDPKWKTIDLVAEPLDVYRIGRRPERVARARELLDLVGLEPDVVATRKPREISGGQCQRVAIARALALQPEILILDESVSSLDVSVQAQVINLLEDLRDQLRLAYIFIAHDLSVVRHVSDRVAVMYLGQIVELSTSNGLYSRPRHPYTVALTKSMPERAGVDDAEQQTIESLGEMPSPFDPPSGCHFRTRCPYATELCAEVEPPLREMAPGEWVACHFPVGGAAGASTS